MLMRVLGFDRHHSEPIKRWLKPMVTMVTRDCLTLLTTKVSAGKKMLRLVSEGGEEMKNKTEDLLPKIAAQGGTVHRQFVRCGKASCKCARGELHGPYYYHFVRVSGKLTKRYLKTHEVEQMRIACLARREENRTRRARSRASWLLIREMKARLRDLLK